MIFSDAEKRRRWDAVRSRLGSVDCAVVPSFHNSYYLSGVPILQWGRFAITLLFRESEPVLIIPAFEASAAAASSPIRDVRLYQDDQGPGLQTATARAVDALRERRVTTVGIEAGGMPAAMYLHFQSLLPGTPFIDLTHVIDDVRMVSSPEEIAYIREACRIAASGLNTVLELIQPGVAETDLSTQARVAMDREAGAKFPVSTTCYMQQGERSLECHAASTGDVMRAGQLVEVVCECEVVHYQGAVERCLLVGDASPAVERAYTVMLKAFEAALNAVRPGVSFAAVDRAARRVLIDAGYERITNGSGLVRNILHHTGGRIAAGDLRVYNERTLQPGMVLSVEPWALIPGVGGPRHCELVVVTADGAQPLTDVDRGVLRIDTATSSRA